MGDIDWALFHGADPQRSYVRSAFEGNVVTAFDTQEAVLDYAFDRLSLSGGCVDHPVVITECVLNPPSSRGRTAELLFEAYGVRSAAFGSDAAFAYAHNARAGRAPSCGIAAMVGHAATHCLPLLHGAPLLSAAVRLDLGGLAITEYLQVLPSPVCHAPVRLVHLHPSGVQTIRIYEIIGCGRAAGAGGPALPQLRASAGPARLLAH